MDYLKQEILPPLSSHLNYLNQSSGQNLTDWDFPEGVLICFYFSFELLSVVDLREYFLAQHVQDRLIIRQNRKEIVLQKLFPSFGFFRKSLRFVKAWMWRGFYCQQEHGWVWRSFLEVSVQGNQPFTMGNGFDCKMPSLWLSFWFSWRNMRFLSLDSVCFKTWMKLNVFWFKWST